MPVPTRWKLGILFAVFMQFLLTTGPVYNYNVFFVDLQKEFHKSALFTGWVGSVASALLSLGAPLAGFMASRIGNPRLILLGIVLASSGYLSTSFISSLNYGYLTFSLMGGLGTCFSFYASGSAMLDWLSGEGGNCRVTGFALLGCSVGVMVCGPMLNTLTDSFGWRNTFRILSGVSLVVGVITALPFFKSPENQWPSQIEKDASDPSSDPVKADEPSTQADVEPVKNDCKDVQADEERHLNLFRNSEVWSFVLSITFAQMGWSFVIVNYSSFMEGIGLTTNQISMGLLAFSVGECGGKLAFTVFGDRLPFLKLYVIAGSSTGGAIISGFLSLCSSFQQVLILSSVWGICRSGIYGSYFAAGDEMWRVHGSHAVATVVLIGFGIGILIGTSITGVLYDLSGDYTLSLLALVASFLLSALCMLYIPVKRRVQTRMRTYSLATGEKNQSEALDVCEKDRTSMCSVGTSNPAFDVDI